jgi:hypothetical protein
MYTYTTGILQTIKHCHELLQCFIGQLGLSLIGQHHNLIHFIFPGMDKAYRNVIVHTP